MVPRIVRVPTLALAAALAMGAQREPQPPCGSDVFPAYPERAGAPVVQVWERSDWMPPACVGWPASASSMVVATCARFRYGGGAEGLRQRLGAVSEMSGLRYWSSTNQKWETLIVEAYALSGPEGERRKDFAADEIAAGRVLAVHQQDNLLGKASYELRILQAAGDRLVFSSRNTSAIRYFGLTLFQPGEIQSICFLDRESADLWRYYSIMRMAKQAGILTMGHNASLINRAVAYYRYLAGIPADQEPPAAR